MKIALTKNEKLKITWRFGSELKKKILFGSEYEWFLQVTWFQKQNCLKKKGEVKH
jgi:hypothetical protein